LRRRVSRAGFAPSDGRLPRAHVLLDLVCRAAKGSEAVGGVLDLRGIHGVSASV
jgi:hypothetical protein